MATTYPSFATPTQYANWTGTPLDPNIQGLLDAASAMIRRYCGWHISPVITEDIVVDGSGGAVQSLPTLRLVDVSALTETTASTITQIDPATLEWSRNGQLRKPGIWTTRFQGIAATIEHGYEADDCLDLATLCATMAARAQASPFGEKQTSVGSVAVTLSNAPSGAAGGVALYSDQLAQLDAYRLNQRP
jgi:hypothetical protein